MLDNWKGYVQKFNQNDEELIVQTSHGREHIILSIVRAATTCQKQDG